MSKIKKAAHLKKGARPGKGSLTMMCYLLPLPCLPLLPLPNPNPNPSPKNLRELLSFVFSAFPGLHFPSPLPVFGPFPSGPVRSYRGIITSFFNGSTLFAL